MEVSVNASRDAQSDQSSTAGGPSTQEGKEEVRWNATRHGISSPQPVVPGLERRPPELRAEVLADRLAEREAELAKEQGRRG